MGSRRGLAEVSEALWYGRVCGVQGDQLDPRGDGGAEETVGPPETPDHHQHLI